MAWPPYISDRCFTVSERAFLASLLIFGNLLLCCCCWLTLVVAAGGSPVSLWVNEWVVGFLRLCKVQVTHKVDHKRAIARR
eukprot:3858019-Amphidinium_carterae.1